MLMVAFIFKPWVNMIVSSGAVPRVLADDILVAASGDDHKSSFVEAFHATLQYIKDIGATVAPDKSYLISTNRVTRKSLRVMQWPSLNHACIPVKLHVRDLGTHICTTEGKAANTLSRRVHQAIATLTRVRRANYPFSMKAHICRTLVLPGSLYGVEACDIPRHLVSKLRSSLARATNKGSTFQCNAIMFQVASYGIDLDPCAHIALRRVTMLRRYLAKFPSSHSVVDDIMRTYQSMGFVGTSISQLRKDNTEAWRLPVRGPVGLLLHSLASFRALMLPTMEVWHAFGSSFNLLTLPCQALKRTILDCYCGWRFLDATQSRSEFGAPFLMDQGTLQLALKRCPAEDYRLLVSILGLGRWNEQRACKFDSNLSPTCQLCHTAEGCLSHLLWDCPRLAQLRSSSRYDFSAFKVQDIHPLIRYGLPPP